MNHPNPSHRRECFGIPVHIVDCLSGRLVGRLFGIAAVSLLLLIAPRLSAQAAGTIEGRVQNAVTGEYLENARVSVKGGTRVAFTDASGSFLLSNVPPGPVTLRVFFTGLDEKEVMVNVGSGAVVRQDLELTSRARYGDTDTVKLDEFVVQSTRETNASAIAVNEQRFAGNIISVVSTDEFGTIVDKNPGEFLKWLPGVDVEYFANNIVGVSVRGLGAVNTEVNFDGMPVASANAEGTGRNFDVQYSSASDIARVEIRKLPLPEDSANALGGSINLVRRSAFEYSKRRISYSALFTSDGESLTFARMQGPKDTLRSRWRPNWEVKWTEPLSKTLGFAVSVGQNNVIANTHWSLPGWNLGNAANNTAAETAIAAGRPVPTVPSIFNPAIQNPLNHNAPLMQGKDYASVRVDWRATPELTLGYSLSGTHGWKQVADDIRFRWNAAQTGSGDVATYNDPFSTRGRVGGGGIYHDNPLWRDIKTPTVSNVLEAKWRRGLWTVAGKGVYSHSSYRYFDTEHGFFNSSSVPNVDGLINIGHAGVGAASANPIPFTINYDDQTYWGPKTITAVATTATPSHNIGDPVDWWKLTEQRIGGARSRPGKGKEIITASKLFVKRDLDLENPLSLQLGFDYTERYKNRRYPNIAWRFVGADGQPSTADDSTSLIAADHLHPRRDSAYDYPAIERISMSKLYSLYKQHPGWFQLDEARTARLSLTSNPAYDLTETTYAPYIQFDWRGMRNRLRLTGGVRYEKNEAQARGLLINNSAAYMKYADGTVVHLNDRDASGAATVVNRGTTIAVNYQLTTPAVTPATRAGAPIFLPHIQAAGNAARAAGETTDTNQNLGRGTLAHTAAVYTEKGAYAEGENDNYFPSLHATYGITENLQWQIGYARTQAKNRFDRSVIPHSEVIDNIDTGTGALGRVNVRNKELQPWVADNFETRLSYYSSIGGVIGLGVYRKNIDDYQREVRGNPLTAQEASELGQLFPELGIGPEHAGYELNTWVNVGKARVDGAEFELRQSLDPFVPAWARGFLVRGAVAYSNLKGQPAGGDFNGLREWRDTVSVTYRNRKLSATVGYVMNGINVTNGAITSNGRIGEELNVSQHMVDFNVAFAVTKWASLFVAGSNITDERRAREQRYEGRPTWGSMTSSNTFGITYTVGITGSF